ncbi:S46 family peptidase [Pseudenhygromyxa sp. WMMC2535]|uniref:S46 family peptidase n=1 Tax=Pseudenhygromyxa sp. WMMC2535 TaxID=2712867 RepID=UPI001552618B|nr:S46 family peptidase [Pseudenhygromyxa sp. WMMC2535]NVB40941.1 S46 family peptidase [Pseudenhygromyxa sp. WMMC2535]
MPKSDLCESRLPLVWPALITGLAVSVACAKPDAAPVEPQDPAAVPDDSTAERGPFENPGGMWMPAQLASAEQVENLKWAGLELDPAVLTAPTEFPLGAIVSLGGCSASFVSDQGLLITNHHCVTRALARNSKKGENLLVDGFLAKTKAEERWAGPGQRVYVTNSFTDVTDTVLAGLEDIEDPAARDEELHARRKKLSSECEAAREAELGEGGVRCVVPAFFEGAQFFLIEQLQLRDIRLVHAPDAGVGVFGGEIDNWRWPRHTGDYSFFRAYVGADGKPADYAETNVPYEPKHVLKVATEDLDEGDFVMVAGYPGRTSRLKTAEEVADAVQWYFPRKIARYEQYLAAIEGATGDDETLQIKANPLVRGLGNGLTNAKGMLDGLGKGGLAEERAEQQRALQTWIEADEQRKAAYGTVLADIEALNHSQRATRDRDEAFAELMRASGLLGRAMVVIDAAKQRKEGKGPSEAEVEHFRSSLEEAQRSFSVEIDRAILRLHLQRAAELPAAQQPEALRVVLGVKADAAVDDAVIDKALDRFYAKTKLATADRVVELYANAKLEKLEKSKDPFIVAALALVPMKEALEARKAEFAGEMAVLRPRYIAALREFAASRGETLAPDANSTLRVTYGTVRGYQPAGRDEPYTPFTVVSEMLAKHTGEAPFNLPEGAREAIAAKNFGPYVDPELGELPIDFLADLDITGGNSGSPTLNARGELIGLVFDGNYEAMASDWVFMPEITRSIHVDIRAVLWMMDAVDQADHLLEEMGVQPSL